MSEYLSKKAVLEHIRREIDIIDQQKDGVSRYRKTFSRGAIRGLENLEHAIQSGAFDADNTEIQRLRAALEKARTYIFNGYDLGYINDREGCTKPLLRQIDEALSTTTEPTGAERVREHDWVSTPVDANDLIGDLIGERCPKCGADMLGNKVGDKWCSMVGCDYDINAPEKVGTEEWRHKYFGAEGDGNA